MYLEAVQKQCYSIVDQIQSNLPLTAGLIAGALVVNQIWGKFALCAYSAFTILTFHQFGSKIKQISDCGLDSISLVVCAFLLNRFGAAGLVASTALTIIHVLREEWKLAKIQAELVDQNQQVSDLLAQAKIKAKKYVQRSADWEQANASIEASWCEKKEMLEKLHLSNISSSIDLNNALFVLSELIATMSREGGSIAVFSELKARSVRVLSKLKNLNEQLRLGFSQGS